MNLDAEFLDALARFLIGHIDWEHAPGRGDLGRSESDRRAIQPDEVAFSWMKTHD
jgi:hypothetical protein